MAAAHLGDPLEGDTLEILDPHPHDERPVGVKDGWLEVLWAFRSQRLERAAALVRIGFLDEDDWLALGQRRANLPQAVLRGGGGR